MLKPEYRIQCRWGLLNIQQETSCPPYCSLVLNNGHTLVTRTRNTVPGQHLLPFSHVLEAEQFLRSTENIAGRVLKAIAPISVRKDSLLEFCLTGGISLVELLEDCPAMALLLALKVRYDPAVKSQAQVATLARLKRHEILQYCLYPAEKWVVGLLGKIPAAQCSPYLLEDLKRILQQNDPEQIKILRHLKQVSRLVVDVMKDGKAAEIVDRVFYHSAGTYPETDGDIEAEYLIREIVRFSREAREINVPLIRNVKDLQRIHDLYVKQFYALDSGQCLELEFGKPPVTKKETSIDGKKLEICPLQTGKELFLEGVKLHHCIASYANAIAHRDYIYAYHVVALDGEEATIMIVKDDITWWRLVEIRGYCNQEVSVETVHFVKEWLTDHNARIREAGNRENKTDTTGI